MFLLGILSFFLNFLQTEPNVLCHDTSVLINDTCYVQNYANNLKDGVWECKEFFGWGYYFTYTEYHEGKLNGTKVYSTKRDKFSIRRIENYVNGKLEGVTSTYDHQGRLSYVYIYNDGLPIREVSYDDEGRIIEYGRNGKVLIQPSMVVYDPQTLKVIENIKDDTIIESYERVGKWREFDYGSSIIKEIDYNHYPKYLFEVIDLRESHVLCDTIFSFGELMPKYKDGDRDLMKYLSDEILPVVVKNYETINETIASIKISLIITSTGAVIYPQVLSEVPTSLKIQLEDKFITMPNWTPGKVKGSNKCIKIILPISCIRYE